MLRSRAHPSRPRHPNTDTVPLVPTPPPHAGEDGSAPVFVDSTGRRGRRIRRVVYAAGALCAAYAGVLVLSFMGATPFAPRTILPVPGLPSEKPGTVRETPREDLPGASVAPSSGGASLSPSEVPGPSALPTDPSSGGGGSSDPATEPSASPTPTGGTSPTGSSPGTGPTDSGSPSGTGPATSAGPSDGASSPSPESSGSTPSESPGTGAGAPNDGAPPAASSDPAGP
ncbi:hypothetical protein OHB14_59730 [Streptomyces sp. NBC_01613]|uniref:hypothetical protein n=1 Tax=Streptomyces sp. NBC_01613 TaxID=2975896 RepID=UPI0038677C68